MEFARTAYFGGNSAIDGLWGGKLRGEFDETYGFSKGIAMAGMLISDDRETSTGFINTEGKVVWIPN